MTRLMGKAGSTGDITDRKNPWHAGSLALIDHHKTAVYSDTQLTEPKAINIAGHTHR